MREKIFKIDFYPHDWLIDTSNLSPEDRGIYIQIIMLMYAKGGPIDNNHKWISQCCNCSPRLISASLLRLSQDDFIQLSAQKISQKRVEHELNTKRTLLEHSSKGGRTSAEMKLQSNKNNKLVSSDNTEPLPSPTTTTTTTTTTTIREEEPLRGKKKILLEELSVEHIQPWLSQKRAQGKYLDHDENFILEYFKNYCLSKNKKYTDYVAGLRNAFEWKNLQPAGGHNANPKLDHRQRLVKAIGKNIYPDHPIYQQPKLIAGNEDS